MALSSSIRLVLFSALLASTCGCAKETLLDSYANKKTESAETSSSTSSTTSEPDSSSAGSPAESSAATVPDVKSASPQISDNVFRTAAQKGDGATVAAALEQGVDVNSPNENGTTALMFAAYDGHTEVVKLLLKNKAQVNRRDAMDRTALIYSSSGKNPETVKVLLEAGAKVGLVDNDERFTALMFAAAEGNVEVAKLLLEYGANPALADKDGETSIQFAANKGHGAMVELLTEALAARSAEKPVNK